MNIITLSAKSDSSSNSDPVHVTRKVTQNTRPTFACQGTRL